MSSLNNVVIAVDTSIGPNQLKVFSNLDFIKNSDLTLVHLIQDIDYGEEVYFNVAFPNDEDKSKLNHAVIEKMKQFSQEILPSGHLGHIDYKCIFAEDIKDAFCRYLLEAKADLAIVASFQHHNIFDVSFGDYISNKAPCGVTVIKNKSPKIKNVVVGVKLDEDLDLASSLSEFDFLTDTDITLLHVSKFSEYSLFSELDLTPYSIDEEKLVVEQEVVKRLEHIKEALVRKGFQGEILTVCEFSNHPKKHFLFYMKKNQLELAILFRGKKKIIQGSFVQYLLHHSNVSTMVLKTENDVTPIQHFHPSYLNRLKGNSEGMRHT